MHLTIRTVALDNLAVCLHDHHPTRVRQESNYVIGPCASYNHVNFGDVPRTTLAPGTYVLKDDETSSVTLSIGLSEAVKGKARSLVIFMHTMPRRMAQTCAFSTTHEEAMRILSKLEVMNYIKLDDKVTDSQRMHKFCYHTPGVACVVAAISRSLGKLRLKEDAGLFDPKRLSQLRLEACYVVLMHGFCGMDDSQLECADAVVAELNDFGSTYHESGFHGPRPDPDAFVAWAKRSEVTTNLTNPCCARCMGQALSEFLGDTRSFRVLGCVFGALRRSEQAMRTRHLETVWRAARECTRAAIATVVSQARRRDQEVQARLAAVRELNQRSGALSALRDAEKEARKKQERAERDARAAALRAEAAAAVRRLNATAFEREQNARGARRAFEEVPAPVPRARARPAKKKADTLAAPAPTPPARPPPKQPPPQARDEGHWVKVGRRGSLCAKPERAQPAQNCLPKADSSGVDGSGDAEYYVDDHSAIERALKASLESCGEAEDKAGKGKAAEDKAGRGKAAEDRAGKGKAAEDKAGGTECAVCLEVGSSTALSPCGHVLCAFCAPFFVGKRCPLCKTEVAGTLRIFL
jgi:hypothetical protein